MTTTQVSGLLAVRAIRAVRSSDARVNVPKKLSVGNNITHPATKQKAKVLPPWLFTAAHE
jgi:hypothetical protein